MLSQKMQIQAIADRLAHLPTNISANMLDEPWKTCWQAIESSETGQESQELVRVLENNPDRNKILEKIFATEPGQTKKFPSLEELSKTLKPIEWILEGWLPRGMLTVLGAAPGVGKSFLGMDLVWRITSGKNSFDGQPINTQSEIPRVIYVDAEAIPQVINERAIAYGINRNRLFLMYPESGESIDFSEDKHRYQLIDMVASIKPELVIIDSLSSIHSRGQNNVEDVRELLRFLSSLAQSFNTGLLLIHHIRKPGGGRDMQSYNLSMSDLSGSGHISAMARVIWGLHIVQTESEPNPNGPRRLKMLKTNFGAYEKSLGFTFIAQGESAVIKWLDSSPEDYRAPTKLDKCKEWLLRNLENSEKKPAELVKAGAEEGFARAMIYQARQELEAMIENTDGKNSPKNRWRLR